MGEIEVHKVNQDHQVKMVYQVPQDHQVSLDPSAQMETVETEDEEDLREIQDSWDTKVKQDHRDPKEAEVCQDTVDHQETRDLRVLPDQQDYQDQQELQDPWDYQVRKDQQENKDPKDSQEQTDKLVRVEIQDHQVYQVHQPFHHGWEVVFLMVLRREATKKTVEATRNNHQRKKNLQRTTPSTPYTDSTLQTNLTVMSRPN